MGLLVKRVLLASLACVAMQPAIADNHGKLVGTWKLVSYEMEVQATGAREAPLGANPSGYILFTADGRLMVVLTGEGRKAAASDQDRAELLKSLVAYTGLYRVEGGKWIAKVDVAHNPAWVGTEQARSFKLDGERLEESTALMNRPDKGMVRWVLNWMRVK